MESDLIDLTALITLKTNTITEKEFYKHSNKFQYDNKLQQGDSELCKRGDLSKVFDHKKQHKCNKKLDKYRRFFNCKVVSHFLPF